MILTDPSMSNLVLQHLAHLIEIGLYMATVVYSAACAFRDSEEHMIYTSPGKLLVMGWIIYMGRTQFLTVPLVWFLAAAFLILWLMKRFKVWGEGDSDFMELFVCVCIYAFFEGDILGMSITLLILTALALALSVLIAKIISLVKKKPVGIKDEIAATPGMALVLCVIYVLEVIV